MSFAALCTAVRTRHLAIFAALHPAQGQTMLLLGPHEPGFWPHVSTAPELRDGRPDPLDRWSKRVIWALARDLGAGAIFPSDGPPHAPFIRWALDSGWVWSSPVGLLVHARAGLMVSFRGALRLGRHVALPPRPQNPCKSCVAQPCRAACPVGALGAAGYDLAACHGWLEGADGRDCLNAGCGVRRACPVSRRHGRLAAQSAFHMKAFHPR